MNTTPEEPNVELPDEDSLEEPTEYNDEIEQSGDHQ